MYICVFVLMDLYCIVFVNVYVYLCISSLICKFVHMFYPFFCCTHLVMFYFPAYLLCQTLTPRAGECVSGQEGDKCLHP